MWYAKVYDPLQAGSLYGSASAPHDAAICRAQVAHYAPPKSLTTSPEKTLFVGRLSTLTTQEGLAEFFRQYGTVTHVRLVYNMVTGISQGYGFVTFESSRDAQRAYARAHKAILDQHVILVDYERSRTMAGWKPRRLGGGFGGKKESGQLRFGARDRPFRWPVNTDAHIPQDQQESDCWHPLHRPSHPPVSRDHLRSRYPPSRSPSRDRYSREHRSSNRSHAKREYRDDYHRRTRRRH